MVVGVTAPLVLVHPPGERLIRRLSNVPPLPHTSLLPRIRVFSPAQPPKVNRSVRYAWPSTLTTPESAVPKTFGMDQRPGAARTTREDSSLPLVPPFAAIGTVAEAAPPAPTSSVTSAQGVETKSMGLRDVLELRRSRALTPYRVDAWHYFLHHCNLHVKYPNLVDSLRNGFNAGIPPILSTYTPPNGSTLHQHPEEYQDLVSNEFRKGRYIGPCSRQEVEALIGPFQSSPLSLVPKPGKPGKFRAVHNFSFPHTPTPGASSINSSIDADAFPCTWGTFATICFTIFNLPPGSQAAIRDVAEAYRTIPILPEQWPGLVVKLREEDKYAINICNNFGLTSAGGLYGEVGDATLDIFRVQGIGPSSKWVDDHIFFRILRKSFRFSFSPCTE